MSDLEALGVAKRVLSESLGLDQGDVWTTCRLREDLDATEPEDFVDIAFRLNRYLSLGLDYQDLAKEVVAQKDVADFVNLIRIKMRVKSCD